MTEYCREPETLIIYHIGAHKCPLKPDTNECYKQVTDQVLRNSACDIQLAKGNQAVTASDIKEAW